jgi:leucyl/phenylalanyl-tRNA---protein transferase
MPSDVTPETLLQAYRVGLFPMAEDAETDNLFWCDPETRTILPLQQFHVPRRLQRTIRQRPYRLTVNHAFDQVIRSCAAPREKHDGTWINDEIIALYTALHARGHAHSFEVWEKEALIGGLYGVQFGGVFCGESMFSRRTDASKIALIYLVACLRAVGAVLLDAQFMTEHLRQFGAVTMARADYRAALVSAGAMAEVPSLGAVFAGGTYAGTEGLGATAGVSEALDTAVMAFLQAINQTS